MPLAYPIHERTLPNGLRVIVSPDHSVPTVTVNLWVGVGSRHESPGRTGFAHLFEHLMFQGSRNVRSGEHFEALLAHGARLNATTWFDRTNYFETVPTGATELALWLEADRHGHLLDAVTQENLDNQRDVVKEEKRQRYDNAPYGDAFIEIYAALFPPGHPYHHPTIGSMEDLDAASLEDVHAFFAEHYAPDNTVLTLCGDITAEHGFELVERHFGPLTAAAAPRRPNLAQLEPLLAPVRVERRTEVPNDRLHLCWRLPADTDAQFLACALALDCIAGLSSSDLVTRLVRREQVATSLHGSAWGFVDGVSIGMVTVDIAAGQDAAAVEAAVLESLTLFAEQGPSEELLAASHAQTERAWLHALAAQDERADLISHHAMLHGDPHRINTQLDTVLALGVAEVRAAAARWLRPEQRATIAYLATPSVATPASTEPEGSAP